MNGAHKINFLSGNMLKIIGAIAMVIDHIGFLIFPTTKILRIIGRLSFPIYALMIAEGCKYTKNKKKYFSIIFLLGLIFQLVYYLATKSSYLGILITFSISILMIYALQNLKKKLFSNGNASKDKILAGLIFISIVIAVYVLNRCIVIDYGFWGCMAPVFASLFHLNYEKVPNYLKKLDKLQIHLLCFSLGIILLVLFRGKGEYSMFIALLLLFLYSGERGKYNMKYFFYIFYPLHMVIIYGISFLIG